MVKDDWGTKIVVTVTDDTGTVEDISSATTRSILLTDPSGTETTKSASFTTDGTDGKIEYTTVNGDINASGTWELQILLSAASFSRKSNVVKFVVTE